MSFPLSIWTICRNPDSYTNRYMARETIIDANGKATTNFRQFVKDDIEDMHAIMLAMKLVRTVEREGQALSHNEPEIVEVWM